MRPVFSKAHQSRRAWLVHSAGLAVTCVGTYESVRRTGYWLQESSPQPFVPGGIEDYKLFCKVDPSSIASQTTIVPLRDHNTPLPELNYQTAIGLDEYIVIGPKTTNHWIELALTPARLPKMSVLVGTVINYYVFDCPPGASTYALDVRPSNSRYWKNLFLTTNYFGGHHRRYREVSLPQSLLLPAEELHFRIRMKASVAPNQYTRIPPVGLLMHGNRDDQGEVCMRLWLNPNKPVDVKDA